MLFSVVQMQKPTALWLSPEKMFIFIDGEDLVPSGSGGASSPIVRISSKSILHRVSMRGKRSNAILKSGGIERYFLSVATFSFEIRFHPNKA